MNTVRCLYAERPLPEPDHTEHIPVAPLRRSGQSGPRHAKLVISREVRCEIDGEHTHDRCVGVCYLDGENIGVTGYARS